MQPQRERIYYIERQIDKKSTEMKNILINIYIRIHKGSRKTEIKKNIYMEGYIHR